MNKLLFCGSIMLACSLAVPIAQAGSRSVVGVWKVTFYLEPNRATGATQCIVFSAANGAVNGVATSGHWQSPTFSGWQGRWIQLGDHVRWFGVTGSLVTSASGFVGSQSRFGGEAFNHFFSSNANSSSAGSWTAVRVPNCSGRADVGNATGDDPSK
jgi:hypothetical protein